jgi:hypothetical protein
MLHLIALNFPVTGQLRGIMGVDTMCFQQARKAGLRGTYRAFLSSRDQHLRSVVARRYSEDVPIVNSKNEMLFPSWRSMFENQSEEAGVDPNMIYSFENRQVYTDARWATKIVLHGSYPDGRLNNMHFCASWYTDNMAVTGQASPLDQGKLLAQRPYSCHSNFIVLCVENTARRYNS